MARNQETRPDIKTINTSGELRRWYWLKEELVNEAKRLGLKTSGGKFQILDRVCHFHDTGLRIWPGDTKPKSTSKFDWHSETLTLQTIITDSYRNSQNVRRFFIEHADPKFKFNIEFMAWMKANTGKTLGDAVIEYKAMRNRERAEGFQSTIADHNQFNQYTRDFLADNPDLGIKDVRKYWALKRALPSENGRHVYHPRDLDLG